MTTSPAPLPELTGEQMPDDIRDAASAIVIIDYGIDIAGQMQTMMIGAVCEGMLAERQRCAGILREWVNLCGDTEIKWTSAREYALGAILDTLECIEGGVPFPSVSPSNQKQEG
jgi:hypothetical protein